jgi:hypothetical protein
MVLWFDLKRFQKPVNAILNGEVEKFCLSKTPLFET